MTEFTERGRREIGIGLRDALARLRRRRDEATHQIGILETEVADLGRIEAALMLAADVVSSKGAS